jgi:hypothetical protein
MSNKIFVWHVPPGKWTVKKKFVGQWRVTELQGFDAEYVDLCGPAKLHVSTRGIGRMNFGAVDIELDCKMDDRDENMLQFSFEGGDEGDAICGRGYCLVEGDDMVGRLFRHGSDDFGFRAKRVVKGKNA